MNSNSSLILNDGQADRVVESSPHASGRSGLDKLDVSALLEHSTVKRGHVVTTAILFGVLLIDGYDLHVTGQILPAIAAAFGVSTASLTSSYAVQPIGQALGGLFLSPLADRLGRKRALIVLLALFAIATFLSVFASSIGSFAVTRFLAGAFGGALLPAAASLVADIAPLRRRSAMVGIVYAGLGVGPLLAAGIVATLLEHIGWQGVYVIGAVAPLLIIVPILVLAPESPLHLARNAASDKKIASALHKLGINVPADASFASQEKTSRNRISIVEIFSGNRAAFTLVLWLTCVSGLITITMVGLGAIFFHEFEGIPVSRFAAYAAAAGLMSIFAGISTGFVMDRFGRYRVIGFYSLMSAVSLLGLAVFPFGSVSFIGCMMFAGFFTWGGFQGLNILTPIVYPPRLRSAAVGWKGAVARFASSAAPLISGALLTHGVGLKVAMCVTAAPMLLVVLLVPWLARLEGRMQKDE
jgi:MFS family permease